MLKKLADANCVDQKGDLRRIILFLLFAGVMIVKITLFVFANVAMRVLLRGQFLLGLVFKRFNMIQNVNLNLHCMIR